MTFNLKSHFTIFSNPSEHSKPFDLAAGPPLNDGKDRNQPDFTKYVYDPTRITVEPNCKDLTRGQCKSAWTSQRNADIEFLPRKVLRLIFHDCIPYEDGTGGCDGCLNLEENGNLENSNGLQYTVALLVSW